MANNVFEIKSKTIVLDSTKSTMIHANSNLYLKGSYITSTGNTNITGILFDLNTTGNTNLKALTSNINFDSKYLNITTTGNTNINGAVNILGNVVRTYSTIQTFANTLLDAAGGNLNLTITENEILNGLIIINNGTIDLQYTTDAGNTSSAHYGNIYLPNRSSLSFISINQSVDFSIINNYDDNKTFKVLSNNQLGYIVIGHPDIYKGTSARFKLYCNSSTNYNVYRLS